MSEIRVRNTGTIKLFESDNTSHVTIASPASLSANRTITIPDADVTLGAGTTINNNADNRVITGSGTANTLEGEANLTYNGTIFGVGASADLGSGIHVKASDTSASVLNSGEQLVLERNSHCGLSILSSTSTTGNILFGDSGDNDIGKISYDHADNLMSFTTNTAIGLKINSAGHVIKPKQPTFMTNQTGALTVANGHTLFSTNTTERWDVGANLSGATFTAPEAGFYLITFNVLYQNNTSDSAFEARITTSNRNYSFNRNTRQYANNSTYLYNGGSAIVDMDTNDTSIITHHGPTTEVHPTPAWSWYQGWFLG